MLRLLIPTGSGYTWVEHVPPAPFPDEFLWADLFEPTAEEEKAVESLLTVDVPTRDEMKEIETSSRLYEENGAVYMTATVGTKLDGPVALRNALLKHQDVFMLSFTESLMTYALGRRIEPFDMPAIRKVIRDAAKDNNRFSAFALGVVNSRAFQMSRADEVSTTTEAGRQ